MSCLTVACRSTPLAFRCFTRTRSSGRSHRAEPCLNPCNVSQVSLVALSRLDNGFSTSKVRVHGGEKTSLRADADAPGCGPPAMT